MWRFPARFLIEFFAQSRDARAARPPAVADGRGRLASLRARRSRSRGGTRLRLSTPVAASRGMPTTSQVTPRGGEPERFDEVVLATHSDQALRCSPTRPTASTSCSARSRYQANEAVLHTDPRMLPRRRRAWASWNYHLLDEPTGKPTVTYHMNRLQSLRARRRVLRDAQPQPTRSTRRRSSARSLRAPGLHGGGPGRAGRHARDQRPEPHALLRRVLGLGLPRGRRRERRARRGGAAA